MCAVGPQLGEQRRNCLARLVRLEGTRKDRAAPLHSPCYPRTQQERTAEASTGATPPPWRACVRCAWSCDVTRVAVFSR